MSEQGMPPLPASEAYVEVWRKPLIGPACPMRESANVAYYTDAAMHAYGRQVAKACLLLALAERLESPCNSDDEAYESAIDHVAASICKRFGLDKP